MAAPRLTGYEDLAPGAKAGRTGYEDLAPAPQRVTGYEDLAQPAPSGRSAVARLATGFKLGLQGAASNMARQAELAGIDSAREIADQMAPTEEPEGLAGKAGAAAGTALGLAPEFVAASLASTVATGTPIPGIVAAGAASGAAGAPEGERIKGAVIGGGTGLILGAGGHLVRALPWAVRALATGGGAAGISAGVDVAEGRPVDPENAIAQGLVFGTLGASEPVFGAVAKARAARLEQLRASNRAKIGAPAEPPPGTEAGSQIPVSAPQVDVALAPAVASPAISAPPAPPRAAAPGAPGQPERLPAAPEPAEATTSLDPRAEPVREIPVERLSLSADVPNFKGEALSDTGVVPGKELGGAYERLGTAPIVAWERLDGSLEIITGRHRFDLARRTGEPTIPTQVVREADGFTKARAQAFDAESNIRDGQGSTLDYARYFRGSREGAGRIEKGDAEARGLLARAKGRSGWVVGNDATDDLYTLFAAGRINDAQAVAIARAAPGDVELQQVGMHYAISGRPADYIANIIHAARAARNEKQAGGTLDLFGKDDRTLIAAQAMAEVATSIQRGIRERISAVSGASRRPEAARELGVDVRDPQSVRAAIATLRAELGRWESWSSDPELVARTRAAVAANAEASGAKPAGAAAEKKTVPSVPPEPAQPTSEAAASEAGTALVKGTDPTAPPWQAQSSPGIRPGIYRFNPLNHKYPARISKFSDRVYYESGIDDAMPFIGETGHSPGLLSSSHVFLSNHPDHARASGGRGILLEFDPEAIYGRVSTGTPLLEEMESRGVVTILSINTPAKGYQDALRSVTIRRNPDGDVSLGFRLLRLIAGWEKIYNEDGSVTFVRPRPERLPAGPSEEPKPISAQLTSTAATSEAPASTGLLPPGESQAPSGVAEPKAPYDATIDPFAATPAELAAESARVQRGVDTGLGPRLTRPAAPQKPPPVGHPAVDEVLEAMRSEEPLPPQAANLSLDAITSEEGIQRALHATAEAESGFPGSVHRVPTEETLARAQASGLSPDELALVAKQAQTNPDAALRAGLLMRAGARDVLSAAQEAIAHPSAESRANLALAVSRLAAIENTYAGLGNAAGRFLNVFGQLRKLGAEHEATMKIVERAGGPGNLDAIAEALGRLESPEQVVAAARALVPTTRLGRAGFYLLKAGDWIKTAWINGLVSGPHTHSVTMTSNIINGTMTELERAGSIPVGMLRRAFTRDKSERVTVREMHARLANPVLDTMDALKIAKSAFFSQESRYGEWSLDQIPPGAKGGLASRIARNIITAPMRALVTESEFFRATSYARELRGLATRKALGMGPATPEEFAQRVQSVLANPPEAIVEAARQRALEVDAATKLRGHLASIETLAREIPGMWLLVPFFRVSANLARQTLMRTPLAPAMESVRSELAAGGARADLAISRMMLGSGVALTAFLLARQGKINGFGPTDPAKRKVWLAEGNLPYSARYGDHVIDFARLEPVGSLFGIAADYADVAEHASEMEQNQVVTALTLGVVRNLINKTFLTNLHEALNGIYDPARAGAGFVRNLAGSVVPNIVNEAGRIQDPYLREARTVVDAIRARIPKIEALGIEGREALPVRRGPLGDPRISQPGSVGSRAAQAFLPVYRSNITSDPVIREMAGLGMGVGNPAEKVDGIAMTPAERDRFLEQSGRYARIVLESQVGLEAFGRLQPDQRQDVIEKVIRKGREAARADLRLQRFRGLEPGSTPIQSLEGLEPSQSSIPPDVTGIIQ